MNPPNENALARTIERTDELELKVSFLDDAIEKLDQAVIKQQGQIDALIREIVTLKQSSTDGGLAAPRNLRDDLPPHF
ncbi:MAG: SlyX family protein [Cytophagales bacterium]|nr:SlyX family protein [Cytophagales bacterium]